MSEVHQVILVDLKACLHDRIISVKRDLTHAFFKISIFLFDILEV